MSPDPTKGLEKLRDYYAQHGIDFDEVVEQKGIGKTRFLRLNPRFDTGETIAMIKEDLSPNSPYPKLVPWLDSLWGFYAVPATFCVAQSKAYKAGRIYGQDIASGAAVALLMDGPSDSQATASRKDDKAGAAQPQRILDLCCAPGLKLCAIADWLERQEVHKQQENVESKRKCGADAQVLVGVDLSHQRLDVAKNVVQKYFVDTRTSGRGSRGAGASAPLPRIRLYQGDGATFGDPDVDEEGDKDNSNATGTGKTAVKHVLVFDSVAAQEEEWGERKRPNKSSRARERKRLKLLQQQDRREWRKSQDSGGPAVLPLFDRVLVDAECSTDGSLKHVCKAVAQMDDVNAAKSCGEDSGQGILPLLLDDKKMEELVNLQKRLALNGFRLLQPGGVMVYSTCSLSARQNEEVVEYLLKTNQDATLLPLAPNSLGESKLVVGGSLKGTIRFLPNIGKQDEFYGGGFFLAKLTKRC